MEKEKLEFGFQEEDGGREIGRRGRIGGEYKKKVRGKKIFW